MKSVSTLMRHLKRESGPPLPGSKVQLHPCCPAFVSWLVMLLCFNTSVTAPLSNRSTGKQFLSWRATPIPQVPKLYSLSMSQWSISPVICAPHHQASCTLPFTDQVPLTQLSLARSPFTTFFSNSLPTGPLGRFRAPAPA